MEPKDLFSYNLMLLFCSASLVNVIRKKEKYERKRQLNITVFTLGVIVWAGLSIFVATGPEEELAKTIIPPVIVVFFLIPMILIVVAYWAFFRE